MSQLLQRAWLHRGALARLLWPLSLLYGCLLALQRHLDRISHGPVRRTQHLQHPDASAKPVVVVIGNVIAGGAGKTPTVLALLAHLQHHGIPAGVVSRGYGRTSQDCLQVFCHSSAAEVGDEPLLIAQRSQAPVFVAHQRTAAVKALLRTYPQTQVVLCDDGLQHAALQRDIEIAVFDERGLGNGWLLPAGPLREPWPRAVDLILHTAKKQAPGIAGYKSTRRLAEHAMHANGCQVSLSSLQGQALHALAGIAKPEAFFAMLRQQGLTLVSTQALPDHYRFDNYRMPGAQTLPIICTEKDAVKLWAGPWRDQVLSVALVFEPEADFFTQFDTLLKPLLKQHTDHQDVCCPPLP